MKTSTLSESAALPYLDDLARLRIEVFAEFPYLYDGSLDYERAYLKTFFEAKNSVLVLAFDGKKVVGAATGLPLQAETANIRQPFLEKNLDDSSIFYFSESVLLPQFRGRGLGHIFMGERLAFARKLGFQQAVFCAIVRPAEHPRRPVGYRPLDDFWRKKGFEKLDGFTCQIAWQDLDEDFESEKTLQFWSCWI